MVGSLRNTRDGLRRMREKGKPIITHKRSHWFLKKLLGCVDGQAKHLNMTKVHKRRSEQVELTFRPLITWLYLLVLKGLLLQIKP